MSVKSGQECLLMRKRSKNTYLLLIGTPLSLIQGLGLMIGNI